MGISLIHTHVDIYVNYFIILCFGCHDTCSGDEDDDEEPLDWLPIAPEIEDPEEAGWGHLEVRYNTLLIDSSYHSIPIIHTNVHDAIARSYSHVLALMKLKN